MPVMSESRADFPSRISLRAVVIGSTLALVVLFWLLALGGGLGLVPSGPALDARSVRDAGAGFVVWAMLAWIVAALLGGFVSAVSARATVRRDGLLHGIATWAIACLVAGVLSCIWLMAAVSMDLVNKDVMSVFWTRGASWSFVIADALAAGAALLGGFLGVRSEARVPGRAEITRGERPVAGRPAPQPT